MTAQHQYPGIYCSCFCTAVSAPAVRFVWPSAHYHALQVKQRIIKKRYKPCYSNIAYNQNKSLNTWLGLARTLQHFETLPPRACIQKLPPAFPGSGTEFWPCASKRCLSTQGTIMVRCTKTNTSPQNTSEHDPTSKTSTAMVGKRATGP